MKLEYRCMFCGCYSRFRQLNNVRLAADLKMLGQIVSSIARIFYYMFHVVYRNYQDVQILHICLQKFPFEEAL